MPAPEPTDRTADDFRSGEADTGLFLATTSKGPEIILTPHAVAEFGGGADLPPHWYVEPWKEGDRAEQGNGALELEAATVGLQGLYPSERSLEFCATFRKRPHQHIGFGTNFRTVPWITFSTKFGHGLYARTNFVIPEENRLPTSLLNAPHRFRIEWNVLEVQFSVDGRRVAHQLVPMVGYMRPLASNASAAPDPLIVEWMRMSPYARQGSFTSRIHDAGAPVVWTGPELDAEVPPPTSVTVELRGGNTPQPDGSWTPWARTEPGGPLNERDGAPPRGRYGQYRVTLASADSRWTPVLRAVRLAYSAGDGSASPPASSSSPSQSSSSGASTAGGTSGA